MKLEFQSKSLTYSAENKPLSTRVILGNADGATVPVNLPPASIDKENDALFEDALDALFTENFADRKVKETDEKVDRLQALIDVFTIYAVTKDYTGDDPIDPTLYGALLKLVPDAVVGKTYKANDVVALVDSEINNSFGTGQRVLVQFIREYTYTEADTIKTFYKNGKNEQNGVGVAWPWPNPRANH
nr:MAG TPA: Protein of unknown function (DUF1366) [Caudoviricetes sp.]